MIVDVRLQIPGAVSPPADGIRRVEVGKIKPIPPRRSINYSEWATTRSAAVGPE